MAIFRVQGEDRRFVEVEEITRRLERIGIDYERWEASRPVAPDAPAGEVLDAYSAEIESLKARGGYVTADVIDVGPATPGLDAKIGRASCRERV